MSGRRAEPLARRMGEIRPFQVMRLLARARELEAQGRDIVHMEVGEPDFDTPAPITEAGIQALREGHTHYTPAMGLPALRQAIAKFYASRYGVSVSADRIAVTPGASGALLLALGVLVNPGDKVLVTDPGYPCNRHFVRLLEGEAVALPVGPEAGFQPTAEQVERQWSADTIALMLASPANPTGTLVSDASLHELLATVSRRGGRVIADEIYHGLVYDAHPQTALAYDQNAFVINSFSKYFGMTGWRLGWLVVPEGYEDAVDRLAQNVFLAAPTPAQVAALAAFSPETLEILEQRRQAFQERRDFLVPALEQLGFAVPAPPQGAFYVYAECSRFTDDSYAFAQQVLEEAGVAITPGTDFGDHDARRYVRFAYTTDVDLLAEGVERLRVFLES